MVKESGVQLDFVFMATCHSETAAKVFQTAGAMHVIGIHRDETILDEAVLTFTQAFYAEVWKERSQICKCFEKAKFVVNLNHGQVQAQKFIMFLSKRHD
jgi:hypothetical protein